MMTVRRLQLDEDCIGQHMTGQPEYNGMVGTVQNIFTTTVIENGKVRSSERKMAIVWANGKKSIQLEHQLRPLRIEEEAAAKANMIEVLLRFTSKQ